ncbi:MAG: N-acetylmuramic acid 6-phosphate etherase [Erysipelotrichaceae bacterium]|nr:N-acetylmuramic acid 6-phosphate etherase [Erysipelotrichaceae bacterium]
MIDLERLETEKQNNESMNIDEMSTLEILQTINRADRSVPEAIGKKLDVIAEVVDVIVEKIKNGGKLFYIGAGTSGRLGFLDAAECPPTYGVDEKTVQGIMCGGFSALYKAKEGAEDDRQMAVEDVRKYEVSDKDVLVGIAASGRTPYTIAALDYANKLGAVTIALTCNEGSELGKTAQYAIEIVTGPEVISGSTRMKAGTAQKLVLNMISTTVFVRLGRAYNNLMVQAKATNAKLVQRSHNNLMRATGCSAEEADELYRCTGGDLKKAIFIYLTSTDEKTAEEYIEACEGHLKQAIRKYSENGHKPAEPMV